MNASPSIQALAVALVAIQGEIKNPAFDKKNPHFKNDYAGLAGIRDTITPVCAKHGVAVLQFLGHDTGHVTCETVLMHSSGEWVSGTFSLPAKQDAQGYGSSATYARRYGLLAALNIVGDQDDDAEGDRKKGADEMPESQMADHLAAIDTASTADELHRVYVIAFKACARDQKAQKRVIEAKDKRKAKLGVPA